MPEPTTDSTFGAGFEVRPSQLINELPALLHDSLADSSFALNRAEYTRDLQRQTGRKESREAQQKSLPIEGEAGSRAEKELRIALRRMAEDSGLLATKHYSPDSPARAQLAMLKHVASEVRLEFARELICAFEKKPSEDYYRSTLARALTYYSTEERSELLNDLLEKRNNRTINSLKAAVLKSCADLEELTELVIVSNPAKLFKSRNNEVKDLVALAVLGQEMRLLPLPKELSKVSTIGPVLRVLDEIKAALKERIEACQSNELLASTRTAKEFAAAALYNLEYLKEERSNLRSTKDLRALANFMIAKIKLECRFCLALTNEQDEYGENLTRWTRDEIKEVYKTLQRIPERIVLFTPLLFRIEKVEDLGKAIAHRDFKGNICIAETAIGDDDLARKYRGYSSLASTLCHELGHSIHIGSKDFGATVDKKRGVLNGPADPNYDFGRFLSTSGWVTFERRSYQLKEGGQAVKLNGKEMPLDVPTRVDGKMMVLIYDQSDERLYGYDAGAEFSLGTYCRTSPWEDWAESFADYILLPERLIQYAPLKFQYFEEEFGKYDEERKLQKALAKRLEQRRREAS